MIGAVLFVGGAALTAASLGWLPVDPATPLVPTGFVERWNRWEYWAFAGAIAGTVLLAVLGFLLLRSELRGRGGARLADRVLATGGPPGRIRIASSALTTALTRDVRNHPGVGRAAAHLTAHPRLEVYLRLTVTPEADIGSVRSHIDAALDRFETTSGVRPELAEVTVAVSSAGPGRVH